MTHDEVVKVREWTRRMREVHWGKRRGGERGGEHVHDSEDDDGVAPGSVLLCRSRRRCSPFALRARTEICDVSGEKLL